MVEFWFKVKCTIGLLNDACCSLLANICFDVMSFFYCIRLVAKMLSKRDGHEKDKVGVAQEQEKGLGKAGRPPTSDGSALSDAIEDVVANVGEEDEQPAGLPFSKGRCIALVLTVTGAAFLNVSGH